MTIRKVISVMLLLVKYFWTYPSAKGITFPKAIGALAVWGQQQSKGSANSGTNSGIVVNK